MGDLSQIVAAVLGGGSGVNMVVFGWMIWRTVVMEQRLAVLAADLVWIKAELAEHVRQSLERRSGLAASGDD